MSQSNEFISKILWSPQDNAEYGSYSNQTTPYSSTQKLATDEVRAPAGVRDQPYRIMNVRPGDPREVVQIEQDQERQANRELELRQSWNWFYTAWNVVACLLCPVCIYCMLGALLCNIFAYIDHMSRDYERERRKLRCALWWSVSLFAIGVIAVIIIIVIFFTVLNAQNWTSIPTVPGQDFTM